MIERKFYEGTEIPVSKKYVELSSSTQLTVRDQVVRATADATTGPITLTLPPVVDAMGKRFFILARTADVDNTVKITHKGDSELWEGDYTLSANGAKKVLESDGLKWYAIV